jgi:hypothetical protein
MAGSIGGAVILIATPESRSGRCYSLKWRSEIAIDSPHPVGFHAQYLRRCCLIYH